MTARLDHLMWAAPDLDAAVAELADRTGVTAAPGGAHPGQGTRNALLALGPRCYLEVIAPDPDQPAGGGLARLISGLSCSRLVTFAVSVDGLVEMGLGGVVAMSRTTPEGDELRWDLAFLGGHPYGLSMPFVIDWGDSPHPAEQAPAGCTLTNLRVVHPDAAGLRAAIATVGLSLPVEQGSPPCLIAQLDTPNGPLRLTSAGIG